MGNEPMIHVIDDDAGARDALAFLLDCHGFATRSYDSAVTFLRLGKQIEPGCIITDVRMPEMSGLELLDRLRTMGVTEPVIVITGHADVPMAIQAMRSGVADFIEKPFSDETILGAIRSALARRAQQGAIEAERDSAVARLAALSGREHEVMEALVDGKANKVIAFDLGISARTVEVYRANVMTKMGARTLSELVRMVMVARLGGGTA
jgi:two-component system response regulator FixJ